MREIEVKARVDDFDVVIKNLEKLGVEISEPLIQNDIIYLKEGVNLDRVVDGTIILRLRRAKGQIIFTFKKQLEGELNNLEHEVIVDNLEEADKIINQLGFREVIRVNKTRRKAKYKDVNICIDEVKDLGKFIEVERLCEEGNGPEIQEELFSFLKDLGINPNNKVLRGYDTLLYEKRS